MKASHILTALIATSAAHFALADEIQLWQVPSFTSTVSKADARSQAVEAARVSAVEGRGDSAEFVSRALAQPSEGQRSRAEVANEARDAVRRGLVQQGDFAGTFDRSTAVR